MVKSNCEIMEEIGGYFELELCRKGHYHKNAILLNSAVVVLNIFYWLVSIKKFICLITLVK